MKKILIANRGEIARRVIRTCREMGIPTVAVFSDPDRCAPFVTEADEAVALGGSTPAESYLRIDAILAAAEKSGADAIHPGYGFLSENAEFARQCEAAGITFIGPPASAIAAMGSKIEAKRLMRESSVPVLPSLEIHDKAPASLLKEIEQLGWPVLIKASAGGGGRGMRIVRKAADWAESLAAAQRESLSGFGSAARVCRALCRSAAAYRVSDLRRHARQRHSPVRARVLDPAALSKDCRRKPFDRLWMTN